MAASQLLSVADQETQASKNKERRENLADFLVADPEMSRLAEDVCAAANVEAPVLITGETGTGKTHLARLIHSLSLRREKPFVVVQCGALSGALLQSELFGHVRGAFTGADRDRAGRFAEAKDGAVLLDDIDCLSLEAQSRLLRVVEERVYEPVGSSLSQRVAARLLAATNRKLEEETAAGRFRLDLYYRINVVQFELPPLRNRVGAIKPLAKRFLAHFCDGSATIPEFSSEAWAAMEGYDWPGNVRELRNTIHRLVLLRPKPILQVDDLPESIRRFGRTARCTARRPDDELTLARSEGELKRLGEALRRNKDNRVRTAVELGVSRATLYRRLHQYRLI